MVVIEWTDDVARTWWKFGGHGHARFPGRARAFVMMLREWVIGYTRPVMSGPDAVAPFAIEPEPAPARIVPALLIPRVLTPAHIRTAVRATAPPSLRRPTVGRTAPTP